MKYLLTLKNAIVVLAFLLPEFAFGATTYVFGVTRYSANHATNVFGILTEAVISRVSAGNTIVWYDALKLEPIATFTIAPDRSSKINPRERAIRYANEIGALKTFLFDNATGGDGYTDIHVTKFLILAGAQLRRPGSTAQIICIGRLSTYDQENLPFSLDLGVPSDGTITAEPEQSPFSTKYRRSVLKGAAVHCAFMEGEWWNDYHREGIERFMSLYISSMTGVLCTFASDVRLAVDRALAGVSEPCMRAEIDPTDTKVEIRRVRHLPVSRTVESTNTVELVNKTQPVIQTIVSGSVPQAAGFATDDRAPTAKNQNIEPEPVQRVPLEPTQENHDAVVAKPLEQHSPAPIASTNGSVTVPALTIAIDWVGRFDLDLVVGAADGSWYLWHKNPSEHGRYISSSDGVSNREYVELFGLNLTDLRSIRAFINLHRGSGDPVHGTATITYSGIQHRAQFRFSTERGDEGRDWATRSKSKHWLEIDLARTVGLVDSPPPTFRSNR